MTSEVLAHFSFVGVNMIFSVVNKIWLYNITYNANY